MPQSESPVTNGAVLEVAILDVRAGQRATFEAAVAKALPLLRRQPGCVQAELRPCVENMQRFILLVWWTTRDAHELGFRRSEDYRRWRALLHGFYEPFPSVEHYGPPL